MPIYPPPITNNLLEDKLDSIHDVAMKFDRIADQDIAIATILSLLLDARVITSADLLDFPEPETQPAVQAQQDYTPFLAPDAETIRSEYLT